MCWGWEFIIFDERNIIPGTQGPSGTMLVPVEIELVPLIDLLPSPRQMCGIEMLFMTPNCIPCPHKQGSLRPMKCQKIAPPFLHTPLGRLHDAQPGVLCGGICPRCRWCRGFLVRTGNRRRLALAPSALALVQI